MPPARVDVRRRCPLLTEQWHTITKHRQTRRYQHSARRSAFSLIELMIGMVILGLGLVMVATIFPVAWSRARTLSEYTVRQSIAPAAASLVESVVAVAGPSLEAASFAGDLFYDRAGAVPLPLAADPANWPTDTWVHALNMENVGVDKPAFVSEDPWRIELAGDPGVLSTGLWNRSYGVSQIEVHQRLHPPIRRRNNVDPMTDEFTDLDDVWDDAVATRRFCWSVLHRLRTPVPTTLAELPALMASTRSFDVYYVTLRRPQPTNRYARQDPTAVPNPYNLMDPTVTPTARPPRDDVMFPVPWRVQVELPSATIGRATNPYGVPTEIQVPPRDFPGSDSARVMLVQMFPVGAQFIDEISGAVYRVTRRRIIGGLGEQAFLTLDREIVREDVEIIPVTDPRCDGLCNGISGAMDRADSLRTVWVFPPPVEPREPGERYPFFSGNSPVVSIDVRTLDVSP